MTFATPPASLGFRFVILDQTRGDRPDLGKFLTPLVECFNEHAFRISGFHGVSAFCRRGSSPTDRAPGEIAMNIRHKQQGDPQGALGWHQETNGIPDIEIELDLCSGLTGDNEALDTVGTHELGETMLNPGANLLVDYGNGVVGMREASDRVQDCIYETRNGLHASNFLLRAAWMPGADGPYDFMSVLPTQLDSEGQAEMTRGGYDIEGVAPELDDVTAAAKGLVRDGARGSPPAMNIRAKFNLDELRLQRMAGRYSRARRLLKTASIGVRFR